MPQPAASDYTIAGLTAAPGTIVRGGIELVELPDGSRIEAPLMVANGAAPGPTLYLGATIHGDEPNGIAILARALAGLDPAALRGRILCVPVQHPLAFQADHRLPLSQFMKSPLDQAPGDAWICFPGKAEGNLAERIAFKLFGLIRQADFAIDIHTPTRGGRYMPIAILPGAGLGPAGDAAETLAAQFGCGCVIQPSQGGYVMPGVLCVEATRAGVPAFTFEIGEGGRIDEATTETGARCVRNALRALGMVDGQPEAPARSHQMRDFLGLRASRGGLLRTVAELGAEVERGDALAEVSDIWGRVLETIRAPEPGVFVRATTLTTVSSGERAATLGLLQARPFTANKRQQR
jgi:predicted deacylase